MNLVELDRALRQLRVTSPVDPLVATLSVDSLP